MPPRTVRILRAAAEEARAAWRWYRDRNAEAADEFLAEYDRALERIEEAPLRGSLHLHGTRKLRVHRYPYTVIYRVSSDLVEVVAVAHGHRRPGYWRQR